MENNSTPQPFYKRPRIIAAFLFPVLVALLLVLLPGEPPGIEVHLIDVGRPNLIGDAILLVSSEGEVALIDGGFPGTGALRYLQEMGINHIDLMVLSHAHDDHSGGLIDVLNGIPVDKLVTNGQTLDSPIFTEFEEAVRRSGVKTQVAKTGDKLKFGRLFFQVLSPAKINPQTVNDNSLVLRLEVGEVAFLFMGDAQELTEQQMMNSGQPLRADVLKIGHHGANTSSKPAFIMEVLPSIGIYSVGPGNMYGFPDPETLDTFDAINIPIYGTDVNGTIVVSSDGKTFSVETEQGGSLDP